MKTDRVLAIALFETFALMTILFLAWCQWRGFDSSFCDSYQTCDWRRV